MEDVTKVKALDALRALKARVRELEAGQAGPVSIVGIGCRLPGDCNGPDEFWQALCGDAELLEEVPADRWDPSQYAGSVPGRGIRNTRGGFVRRLRRFDAEFFGLSPREAALLDPQHRLLLEVAWQAIEDARINPASLEGSATGVFVGISSADYARLAAASQSDPFYALGNTHSASAGRLSYAFGLRGPSVALDTACSSSLVAVQAAVSALRRHECDLAIVGGVNCLLDPTLSVSLSSAGMLSTSGRCRPFDAAADGYVRSEGCGVLVLKRSRDLQPGDRAYCNILGAAVNQNGRSAGLTVPSGEAQERVINRALRDAQLQPAQVRYVEAFGSSSALGDPIEVLALAAAYGRERRAPLQIGSVKSRLGHLEAASGLAALIKTALCLHHRRIPRHAGFSNPSPYIPWHDAPVQVLSQELSLDDAPVSFVGVSSFGFTGTNAHVVLGSMPALERGLPATAAVDVEPAVLPISAHSGAALIAQIEAHRDWLHGIPDGAIADACHACATRRKHWPHRVAVVGRTRQELQDALGDLHDRLRSAGPARRTRGAAQVAFHFADGMGEAAAMAQGLYRDVSPFREVVDRWADSCADRITLNLRALLLEPAANAMGAAAAPLRTYVLQCALADLWRSCDVLPSSLSGEGAGEFAAGYCAGVFSFADGLRLLAQRCGLENGSSGAGVQLSPPRVPLAGGSQPAARGAVTERSYWLAAAPGLPATSVATGGVAVAAIIHFGQAPEVEAPADLRAAERVGLKPPVTLVSLVPHAGDSGGARWSWLQALAQAYDAGLDVAWDAVFERRPRRDIDLPRYTFGGREHWIAESPAGEAPSAPVLPVAAPADTAVTISQPMVEQLVRNVVGIPEEQALAADDNLFDHGFSSIHAFELVRKLAAVSGRNLSLLQLLERPTVAAITERLLGTEQGGAATALPELVHDAAARHAPFELTDIQKAYWMGRSDTFVLGKVSCHVYFELRVRGLDLPRFVSALNALIARHDMLRAVIDANGRQRVLAEVPSYRPATHRCQSADVEQQVERLRDEMSHQVLDAGRWPLFDVRVVHCTDQEHRLHVSLDALIVDALSIGILLRDLAVIYTGYGAYLPTLDITFRDVVQAHDRFRHGDEFRKAQQYWTQRFASLPAGPQLPLKTAPAQVARQRFARRHHTLPASDWKSLKRAATAAGLTPSSLLLAAYAQVLNLWSNEARFCVNVTTFNRLPFHDQVNDLVGDFSSLTLLEVDGDAHPDFLGFARAVQRQLASDLEHRAYSGVAVIRELAARNPTVAEQLMPVVFTSVLGQNGDVGRGAELLSKLNLEIEQVHAISQTPQIWLDHVAREGAGGELVLTWDAIEDLFPDGMLDAMFGAYTGMLQDLLRSTAWDARVLPCIPADQRARREAMNATETALTEDLLHSGLVRQVDQAPDRVAVHAADRTLSYRELHASALQLAQRLLAGDWRPGRVAAVLMPKGWQQVVACYGVLYAGGIYLPIDPKWPVNRIARILARTGCRTVLVTEETRALAAELTSIDVLTVEAAATQGAVVDRASAADELAALGAATQRRPEDTAYIIFTSGSTGEPKGVTIDHRGAVNTILDVNRMLAVTPGDVVFAYSSLCFDLSVYDLFGPLARGAALLMPSDGQLLKPGDWDEMFERVGVSIVNAVPAVVRMWLHSRSRVAGEGLPRKLRVVMMSGDWVPPAVVRELVAARPDLQVLSLGGATEASIWSIYYPVTDVTALGAKVPYGRPMANQTFHVLKRDGRDCPDHVVGDLYIGGVGLAQCYWGDAERTSAQFVTDSATGRRLYRTGDLGLYQADGDIEFVGRKDTQVKINGYRVELGEIEQSLCAQPGVSAACALLVREETAAGATSGRTAQAHQLVAFAVIDELGPEARVHRGLAFRDAGTGYRAALQKDLPSYMVPALIVDLPALPLTDNKKVDRKHLEEIVRELQQGARQTATTTGLSANGRIVADIIRKVTGVRIENPDQDLFFSGIDSVHVIGIVMQLEAVFGRQAIDLRSLFKAPTIRTLAAFWPERSADAEARPAAAHATEETS